MVLPPTHPPHHNHPRFLEMVVHGGYLLLLEPFWRLSLPFTLPVESPRLGSLTSVCTPARQGGRVEGWCLQIQSCPLLTAESSGHVHLLHSPASPQDGGFPCPAHASLASCNFWKGPIWDTNTEVAGLGEKPWTVPLQQEGGEWGNLKPQTCRMLQDLLSRL